MQGASGAFGKIPALGDFFRIRVDQAFVEVWDAWLQESMVAGRTRLGQDWDECYMCAPLWRFSLPPGVAGPLAVVGVLMPSVDRVGRQFPLTLVIAVEAGRTPFRNYFGNAATLDALEALALDTLGDDMTRDQLDARLQGIVGQSVPPAGGLGRGFGGGLLLSDADPAMEAADLAEAALSPGLASIWACRFDGGGRWMTVPDLPRGATAAAMFDPFSAAEPEPVA
jgi:type VI secretion system protein ImpM